MRYWRKPLNIDEVTVPRGQIHILPDRCKGCAYCVEFCPRGVLEMSSSFNKKGYHPPLAKLPEDCVNCKLCEMLCPEFAIWCTYIGEVNVEG